MSVGQDEDELFYGDWVSRPSGNIQVSVAPRGMPLWMFDGGGLEAAVYGFLLILVAGDERGYVVGVRRRKGLGLVRIVGWQYAPTLEGANERAAAVAALISQGAFDEAPHIGRRERAGILRRGVGGGTAGRGSA